MGLNEQDEGSCKRLLAECEMFMKVPPPLISTLASNMQLRPLKENEVFLRQGEPTDRFHLLESGEIKRTHVSPETGRAHNVEFAIKAKSINSMRVISGEPGISEVKCTSVGGCKLYEMKRSTFLKLLETHPQLAVKISEGLCEQLRSGSKKYATPLLEQRRQQALNYPAVAIAAGIESYYRSALNALLNARLTGTKPAALLPNMHIQVPVRIAYITGFKSLRTTLDQRVAPEQYEYPTAVRLAAAVAPGIFMTPISSILEASNAGHVNKEGMATRWRHGFLPRAGREVIFGIGLNQLSDYFEERLQPYFSPQTAMLQNMGGSLLAGIVSGYFSHVPHNLSTYKLMDPQRSYGELYQRFVNQSVPPVVDRYVADWPPVARHATRTVLATLAPRGLVIRTTQIVGSFVILNGVIAYLQLRDHYKIQRALTGG